MQHVGVAAADFSRNEDQFPIDAVGLGIDVTDDFRAREDGKGVVAADAFEWRRVGFPGVIKIPKPSGHDTIIDERVQRGQQRDRP